MKKTILNINETHSVDNHPYANVRTKAFFSIEFVEKKGFRSLFQTINPTTKKLNNLQKAKYTDFLCQYRNEENGHIKDKQFEFFSYKDINPLSQFIAENADALQLKPEMIKYICDLFYSLIKACISYTVADKDKLNDLLNPTLEAVIKGIRTGANVFPQINLDMERINQLKEEFSGNPLTIVRAESNENKKPKANSLKNVFILKSQK